MATSTRTDQPVVGGYTVVLGALTVPALTYFTYQPSIPFGPHLVLIATALIAILGQQALTGHGGTILAYPALTFELPLMVLAETAIYGVYPSGVVLAVLAATLAWFATIPTRQTRWAPARVTATRPAFTVIPGGKRAPSGIRVGMVA